MSKPLESRTGGPNGIDGLMQQGLYAEGPLRENNVNRIMRAGEEINVRPIAVTLDANTPESRIVTVFKPVRNAGKR